MPTERAVIGALSLEVTASNVSEHVHCNEEVGGGHNARLARKYELWRIRPSKTPHLQGLA
jgi:hypothetical protein